MRFKKKCRISSFKQLTENFCGEPNEQLQKFAS